MNHNKSLDQFYKNQYVDAPTPQGYCRYSVADKRPLELMRLCTLASLTTCLNRICGDESLWKDCVELGKVESDE